jgi:hypothetical protein
MRISTDTTPVARWRRNAEQRRTGTKKSCWFLIPGWRDSRFQGIEDETPTRVRTNSFDGFDEFRKRKIGGDRHGPQDIPSMLEVRMERTR